MILNKGNLGRETWLRCGKGRDRGGRLDKFTFGRRSFRGGWVEGMRLGLDFPWCGIDTTYASFASSTRGGTASGGLNDLLLPKFGHLSTAPC